MPYAAGTYAYRVQGVFGATAATPIEIWSFGFHGDLYDVPEAPLADQASALWNAASAYIQNVGDSGKAAFSHEVWLTEVLVGALNPDGTIISGSYTRHSDTPVNGTVPPGGTPIDISFVITLDAGTPKHGRFGRFYPPVQPSTLTLGVIADDVAMARAHQALVFLEAFFTVSGDGKLVVASKTYGTNRPISEIRCGVVPDVQRRRRNALEEKYQTIDGPIPTPP